MNRVLTNIPRAGLHPKSPEMGDAGHMSQSTYGLNINLLNTVIFILPPPPPPQEKSLFPKFIQTNQRKIKQIYKQKVSFRLYPLSLFNKID
jgi:hypothetical protein